MQLIALLGAVDSLVGIALLGVAVLAAILVTNGRRLIGGLLGVASLAIPITMAIVGEIRPAVTMMSMFLIVGAVLVGFSPGRRSLAFAMLAGGWACFGYMIIRIG